MSASSPGRRRLDAPLDYDTPTREPRLGSPFARKAALILWSVAWVAGTAMSVTAIVDIGAPSWLARPGGALLGLVFIIGLTHRCGAQMRLWAPLGALLLIAALVTQFQGLITAAALVTAITGAMFAVMVTRPAANGWLVVREFFVAAVVSATAMVGVGALNAQAQNQLFGLVVILAALALCLGMIWNLGANLHGLSRRELGILIGVAAAIILLIVYGSVVRRYGSEALIEFLNDAVVWMRSTIAGVPRPAEVFIGFPALAIGVAMRARRREGWWVTAFGVVATGSVSSALISPNAYPSYITLSSLYSAVLGLLIGLVVRHLVLRESGARAARSFQTLSRQEPARREPLK